MLTLSFVMKSFLVTQNHVNFCFIFVCLFACFSLAPTQKMCLALNCMFLNTNDQAHYLFCLLIEFGLYLIFIVNSGNMKGMLGTH